MWDFGASYKYWPGPATPAGQDEVLFMDRSICDAWRRSADVSLRIVYEAARRIRGVRFAAVGCERRWVWRIETRVGDTFRAAVKSMLLPPVD
jgi:hypothetical protein